MDYDINNSQLLNAGAIAYVTQGQGQDWRPISSAPHDGTVIEVRCTYGVAPWYGIYRWTDTRKLRDQNGQESEWKSEPSWVKVSDESSGFIEDSTFTWRPYSGRVSSYVDPTGGAQNSAAYWRGAVTAKYGLPLDSFEEQTKKNTEKNATTRRKGFWRWLFD